MSLIPTSRLPVGAPAPRVAAPPRGGAGAPPSSQPNLRLIDGKIYAIKNGKNVHTYDELEERAGNYVGKLSSNGSSIIKDNKNYGTTAILAAPTAPPVNANEDPQPLNHTGGARRRRRATRHRRQRSRRTRRA